MLCCAKQLTLRCSHAIRVIALHAVLAIPLLLLGGCSAGTDSDGSVGIVQAALTVTATGTVRDNAGESIANAVLTFVDAETYEALPDVTTNDAGSYSLKSRMIPVAVWPSSVRAIAGGRTTGHT